MPIERISPRLGAAGAMLAIAALLTGCSSSNNDTTTSGSIDLAITPDSATVPQGQTVTVHGTVSRSAGFTGLIGIDEVNVPTGVIPTLLVRPVNGSDTAVVTIGVGSNVVLGNYTLTIQASAAGVTTVGKPFNLTVVAAEPSAYTIGLGTPVLTLTPGGNAVVAISVTRAFFNDPITLSASQVPDGLTAIFGLNPVTGDSSTVTFTAAASATVGTDTLFIRGTAAGLPDRVDTLPVHIVPIG